jgi:hypothetical protein
MRHAGGYIDKVTLARVDVVLEAVSKEGNGFAVEHIDRSFVMFVQVRFGPAAWRNSQQVHADAVGAHSFGGDATEVCKTLLAIISFRWADDATHFFRGLAIRRFHLPNSYFCL